MARKKPMLVISTSGGWFKAKLCLNICNCGAVIRVSRIKKADIRKGNLLLKIAVLASLDSDAVKPADIAIKIIMMTRLGKILIVGNSIPIHRKAMTSKNKMRKLNQNSCQRVDFRAAKLDGGFAIIFYLINV